MRRAFVAQTAPTGAPWATWSRIPRPWARGARAHRLSLVCCDVSAEYTARAAQAWAEAGLADRVDLRIAPATETLRAMPLDPPIDLAFIDADKTRYATYYELILQRMRTGGVIAIDNVLWSGGSLTPPTRARTRRRCACSTTWSPTTVGSRR